LSTPEFPTSQPISIPSNLAGWGTRAAGLLIDLSPVIILAILLSRSSALSTILFVVEIAYIAYLGHLDGLTGQTPGKAIMGIRVVNLQGELIGSGAGIGRKFAHIVDSLVFGLGYLLPIVDSKRQTIADKIMTTFVVRGVEKKPFSVDLWMPPKA
jgi:uncharacterized RDD family membrane protein YckC